MVEVSGGDDSEVMARILARRAREREAREAKWSAMSAEEILRLRIEDSRGHIDRITTAFLGASVPLWIEKLRQWSPERRERRAHELVEILAYDQAMAALCDCEARGTAGPGELGKAFNAVAEGLACLAFCPGGVVFAGHHWQGSPA